MNPIAFYSKTLFTFVASYHANASPQGEERTGGMTYYYEEGVYLTLCFPAHRNFATFIMYSRDKAMVDACGDMLYIGLTGRHPAPKRAGCALSVITYRRGLLRCSFKQFRAMRRPLCAGRVTGTDSRASFLYVHVSKVTDFCPAWGV